MDPAAIALLEDRRVAATIAADSSELGALLADDLIYTHSNASVDTKTTYIDKLASGALRYVSIERNTPVITIWGDAATVTGQATLHISADGNDRVINISYLNVWVPVDDRWQMVAWQSTPNPTWTST